jgi:hypothetical protein
MQAEKRHAKEKHVLSEKILEKEYDDCRKDCRAVAAYQSNLALLISCVRACRKDYSEWAQDIRRKRHIADFWTDVFPM